MGFFSSLFQNYNEQGSGSGLQGLFGSATYPRYYDEDHERKWRERYGTGQERTNLDAPQTGLSAAQINLRPGLKGEVKRRGGWFGPSFFGERKTNNPVEVAGLGNLVSDSDGSMYGTDSSPALADYMLPQPKYKDMTSTLQEQGQTLKEDEAIVQQDIPSSYPEKQQVIQQEAQDTWLSKIIAGEPISEELKSIIAEQSKRVQSEPTSGKLNENISGNIYAKHGGSVFRNAYDQASNIMYRAGGGGLEGLRESIDINGQPHNLAYINPTEANLLKVLGGAGKEVNGVPAYWFGNGDTGQSSEGDGYAGGSAADFGDDDGVDEGAGTSYESVSKDEQDAIDQQNQAAYEAEMGKIGSLYADLNPEQQEAADVAAYNRAERERNEMDARIRGIGSQQGGLRGRTDAYFDMPGVQALGRDATDEEIAAALQDAQLSWFAAEQHYGESKTEEEKMEMAELYSQEEYRTDAEFAMKVGMSPLDFEAIQNTAKDVKEQKTEDIRESLKEDYARNPDEYGKEPMDLDTIMDHNEEYVEQAQKDAVISSMLDQEGISNFIAHDPSKGVLQLGPGVMETVWDIVTGDKTFNIEEAPQAILSTIMSEAGWAYVDAAAWVANFVGDIMGEKVIGTVDVNDITMNLHESGKLTFGSPEDDPGYDPSSVEGGGDTSGLKAVKRERLPVEEEEEDKSTRSIADLVKKSSPGTGTDSLLEFYQSIYGPDATPFNVST